MDLVKQLRGMVKQRAHAYKAILQSGKPVPDMKRKREAIESIQAQLDFIEGKPLQTQKLCIAAIAPKFKVILPFEYADRPAQLTLRHKIVNIITACEDAVHPNLYTHANR